MMPDTSLPPISSARQFRRFALALCLIGATVQLVLTAYYLAMGHAARPHDLPVGLVAPAAQQGQVTALVERGGAFAVTVYPSVDALETAIRHRSVYGGVEVTAGQPHLYLAGADGASAAAALRTAFTGVLQQQTAEQVAALVQQGAAVPVEKLEALTAAPPITDVVPLPPDDRTGASLGFLVQALALGGTVASAGLGQLIPRTRRSWKRGLGHLTTLLVYALGSAGVVLWTMTWFGVGSSGDHTQMYWSFALASLAITASTAGAVALVGTPGMLLGMLYFTVGTVISGASIPPEFLPAFGRDLGSWLPTGAGTQAVRDGLYFPDASIVRPVTTLALYAGIGCLVVLVTNLLPNRSTRKAELDLAEVVRIPVSV